MPKTPAVVNPGHLRAQREAAGLTRSTFELRSVRPKYSQEGTPLVSRRERHDPPLGVDAPAP